MVTCEYDSNNAVSSFYSRNLRRTVPVCRMHATQLGEVRARTSNLVFKPEWRGPEL